jgi:hypothetical protein
MTSGVVGSAVPPWGKRAALVTLAGIVLGALLIAVGWFGASGTKTFAKQLLWVNLAVVGSALAATAQASWLLRGWRRVGALRREVLASYPRRPASALARAEGLSDDHGSHVTVPGTRRYHRRTCLLVRGKEATRVRGSADLEPCDVCRP